MNATDQSVCPACDGSGQQTLESGCRTGTNCSACSGSGRHVRTVWSWSIGYEVKLSAARPGSPAAGETVTLRFRPQAEIGKTIYNADPQGPDTWEVSLAELLAEFPTEDTWHGNHEDRDRMHAHPNAPQWVRDWSGPYEVELAGNSPWPDNA